MANEKRDVVPKGVPHPVSQDYYKKTFFQNTSEENILHKHPINN